MNEKSRFVVDIGWVTTSMVSSLAAGALLKIFLARYLGPHDLGLYALVLVVYWVATLLAGFGLQSALVKFVAQHRGDPRRIADYLAAALVCVAVTGLFAAALLTLGASLVARFFAAPTLAPLLAVAAFGVPLTLLSTTLWSLHNGLKDMRRYAILSGAHAFCLMVFPLFLTLAYASITGTIWGIVVGEFAAFVLSAAASFSHLMHLRLTNLFVTIGEIVPFGGKVFLSVAVNRVNYQADLLLLGYFLAPAAVGYYSVAIALIKPLWLIPKALEKVTYPRLTEYFAAKDWRRLNLLADATLRAATLLLMTAGLAIILFGRNLITVLFTDAYQPALWPMRLLVLGTISLGAVKAVGSTYAAVGRPGFSLAINSIAAGANVLLNLALIPIYGILGAAIATLISYTLLAILFLANLKPKANISLEVGWHVKAYILLIGALSLASLTLNMSMNTFYSVACYCMFHLLGYFTLVTQDDRTLLRNVLHMTISERLGK